MEEITRKEVDGNKQIKKEESTRILNQVWKGEVWPTGWREGSPIYNKGEKIELKTT